MTLGANTATTTASERPLDRGGVRVLQAYLRILGYYGDPASVRGVDVVDGDFGPRTQNAVARFVRDGHSRHSHACEALLDDVRERYQDVFRPARGNGRPYAALDAAFRQHYPSGGSTWTQLHPVMRFPLLSAIDDLRRQGVAVSMLDGRRSIEEQEGHIREGRSTAPPSASFHDHGLAIDLVPRTDGLNPDNPAWRRIHDTMQRYGFYSLFREQGWDRPHFELPATTITMMRWGRDAQGWKQIPPDNVPAAWQRINAQSLARLSAVDFNDLDGPSPIPPGAGGRDVQRA